MAMHLELSFELGQLDADSAETACFDSGALAVTLSDARERSRVGAYSSPTRARCGSVAADAAAGAVRCRARACRRWSSAGAAPCDRAVSDARQRRGGSHLGARVAARFSRAALRRAALGLPAARARRRSRMRVVVALDPGLAFGTGTHASTALCLDGWTARSTLTLAATRHRLRLRLGRARASRRSSSARGRPCLRHRPAGAAGHTRERRRQRRRRRGCGSASRPSSCRSDSDLLMANILQPVLMRAGARAGGAGARAAAGWCWAAFLQPGSRSGGSAIRSGLICSRYAARDGWVALRTAQRHCEQLMRIDA